MRKIIFLFLVVMCPVCFSATLAGRWKLNEPTGTSGADSIKEIISGNHGTPAKAVTTVRSPVGPGHVFDGSQWVTQADQILTTFPLSMSVWVRQASNQSASLISMSLEGSADGTADRYMELALNSGVSQIITKGSDDAATTLTASESGALSLNVWHLVTAVWINKDDWRIYADGVLVATTSSADRRAASGTDTWTIGARAAQSTVAQKFTGDLSDARIYSTALSAAEAAKLYSAGISGLRFRFSGKKNTGLGRIKGRFN